MTINTIKENSNTVAGVAKWLCKIEIVQYRQLFTVVCSHSFGVCEFFISLPEKVFLTVGRFLAYRTVNSSAYWRKSTVSSYLRACKETEL